MPTSFYASVLSPDRIACAQPGMARLVQPSVRGAQMTARDLGLKRGDLCVRSPQWHRPYHYLSDPTLTTDRSRAKLIPPTSHGLLTIHLAMTAWRSVRGRRMAIHAGTNDQRGHELFLVVGLKQVREGLETATSQLCAATSSLGRVAT